MMGLGFLSDDLDILAIIVEQVKNTNIELQYVLYFETWYRSLLLTRKLKKEPKIVSEQEEQKLERIGSNCMSLLAAPHTCDLTNRDFSGCSMPNAYIYGRDLSGGKITKQLCRYLFLD